MRDTIANALQAGNGVQTMSMINRMLRRLSETEAMKAIKELTTAFASTQHDVALVMGQLSDIPRTSTRAWSHARPNDVALERLKPTSDDDALFSKILQAAPPVPAHSPPPPHSPQPPPVPAAAKYRALALPAGHS
jgi:hypothetical protein